MEAEGWAAWKPELASCMAVASVRRASAGAPREGVQGFGRAEDRKPDGKKILKNTKLMIYFKIFSNRHKKSRLPRGRRLVIPGAPGRTRTCNRRIRSPLLYPLSHERVCFGIGIIP